MEGIYGEGSREQENVGSNIAPDRWQGFGRVNLQNALKFEGQAAGSPNMKFIDRMEVDDEQTVDALILDVDKAVASGADLKITLVWTDPKGSPSASKALINNLDLKLKSPSGSITTVKTPQHGGGANSRLDNINPVEQIIIPHSSLTDGQYTIQVEGE